MVPNQGGMGLTIGLTGKPSDQLNGSFARSAIDAITE